MVTTESMLRCLVCLFLQKQDAESLNHQIPSRQPIRRGIRDEQGLSGQSCHCSLSARGITRNCLIFISTPPAPHSPTPPTLKVSSVISGPSGRILSDGSLGTSIK